LLLRSVRPLAEPGVKVVTRSDQPSFGLMPSGAYHDRPRLRADTGVISKPSNDMRTPAFAGEGT
jgi:hypothetical protein